MPHNFHLIIIDDIIYLLMEPVDFSSYHTLLKMWLNSKEIDYNEVDVTQERSALNKIREAGYSSLPALEINGDFVKYEVYNDILDVL